jgi:hypothetical protein
MLTMALTCIFQEGISNIAINDAFMLEGAIYYLLKKHFRKETYYVDLLELFHDVRLPGGPTSGSVGCG